MEDTWQEYPMAEEEARLTNDAQFQLTIAGEAPDSTVEVNKSIDENRQQSHVGN